MSSLLSITPYFLFSILFAWVAQWILDRSPFYQTAIAKSEQARYGTLDGLRGFLALAVFFHHAMMHYHAYQTGVWAEAGSNFYEYLGHAAVSLFFMITGFLFWNRAIEKGHFPLKQFYTGRIFRVFPLYWVSVVILVLLVAIQSGGRLQDSPIHLLETLSHWITGGLFDFPFLVGTIHLPQINGIDTKLINSGVVWTLTYELQFYLILPLLAWLAPLRRFVFLYLAVAIAYELTGLGQLYAASKFLFGMAAAYCLRYPALRAYLSGKKISAAIFIAFALMIVSSHRYDHHLDLVRSYLLFGVFLAIVSGNTLYGLLTSRSARFLGTISYSVYLLHGMVLFSVFTLMNHWVPMTTVSEPIFWLLTGGAGVLVIGLSSLTYQFVEYPYLHKASPSNASKPKGDRLAEALPSTSHR